MKVCENKLKVHFIGIGGVSMSSLALYLKGIGFDVSGSDIAPFEYVERLIECGCEVNIGHSKNNVADAQVVIYSSAIADDNEELMEARRRKLYILKRAQLLKMISENFKERIGVCGCHGKTTATCMLAHIFSRAKEEFTAHVGGYDNEFYNGISRGNKYFLSEVCEYQKNIDEFEPTIGLCLNIGLDHLECFSDENELIDCYFRFLDKAKKAIVFGDDERLKQYFGEKTTFGFTSESDYYPTDIYGKNGKYRFVLQKGKESICEIKLKVYGRHNIINAVAAAATAIECGIDENSVKRGIEDFTGTKRRFEKIGKIGKATVIADYAHHPDEIKAALECVKEISGGRVFTVFQPHTYSRTLLLKNEFVKALEREENLIIYKTFPAREEYLYGGSAYDLFVALGKKGVYMSDVDAVIHYLKGKVRRNDIIFILGAGDLYRLIKKRASPQQ